MGTAAFLAFLMALCSLRFSAFQYALFSALFSQGRVLFGPFAGMLAPRTGWVAYFSGCCGIGLCALTLVWALRLQLQRLDQSPHP
jgi:PAT family beta-lactamase induction signal transducer AmpG